MREDVRRRLDRAIWLERAKYIGIGLGIVAAIGLAFGYETLDLKVDNKEVEGKVTDIEPLVTKALAGEATYHENLHLVMERHGYPEDTWYTFSYSPVRDETGGIAGMFCACTETTQEVRSRAALKAEQDRLREFFQQVMRLALRSGLEKSENPCHRLTEIPPWPQPLAGNRDVVG